MANQPQQQPKQRPQRPAQPPGAAAHQFDHDDNPGHAPESGEPTETGKQSMSADKGAESGGKRDESGRQGRK